MMLYIDGLFMFLSYSPKTMNDCNSMVIFPLLKSHVWKLCIIFIYLTPFPNGYMCCLNHLHNFKVLIPISGPIKFIFERSLSGKKSQFLFEVVFVVTFGIYLLQSGCILSVNTYKNPWCPHNIAIKIYIIHKPQRKENASV